MKQPVTVIALLLFILGTSACTKKNGENQGLLQENQLPFNLFSTKQGSWWIYGSKDGTVFTRYASGRDSFVNGLQYSYFYRIDSSSKFNTPEFFGKNLNRYLTLIDLDGSLKTFITFVFLKEDPVKNMGWKNTESKKIQGWNVDMLIESSIVRTDGTLIHEGHVFNNVIEVSSQLKAKLKLAPEYTDCGDLRTWFVKDVGIIKEVGDITIRVAGITMLKKEYDDSLMSYHIEP
jgi:hypothetical protein